MENCSNESAQTVQQSVLPERRLCQIAGAQLRVQGWKVYCEVPFWERSIDLAAVKEGKLLLIEAKTSFNKRLESQVFGVSWAAHLAVALVATKPRPDKLQFAEKRGIGVWRVTHDGLLEVVLEAQSQRKPNEHQIERLLERLDHMPEAIDGGMPCLKGVGPAISVEAMVDSYRAAHPKATWSEVYANVPNHYASATSMCSAAYSNRQRRAMRARLRSRSTHTVEPSDW